MEETKTIEIKLWWIITAVLVFIIILGVIIALMSKNNSNTISNTNQTDLNMENSSETNVTDNSTSFLNSLSSDFDGFYIKSGHLNLNYKKVIFDKYSTLQSFCNAFNNSNINILLSKYNDEFFSNNSLAMKYIESSNINDSIDSINAKRQNNSVNIQYNLNTSQDNLATTTSEMNGFLIIVEITKDITSII